MFSRTTAMVSSLRTQRSSQVNNYSKFVWIFITYLVLGPTSGLSMSGMIKQNKTSFHETKQQTSINNTDVCLSEYCIEAANNLKSSINETVDPCENFYQFACGQWIHNAQLLSENKLSLLLNISFKFFNEFVILVTDDQQSVAGYMEKKMKYAIADLLSTLPPNGTIEPKAITNARRLYNACIDEYEYETGDVFEIIALIDKEFGGWPAWQHSTWGKSKFDLSEILLKLYQYNVRTFYYIETKIEHDFLGIPKYRIRNSISRHYDDKENSSMNETQFTKPYQYIIFELSTILRSLKSTEDTSNIPLNLFQNEIAQYFKQSNNQNPSTNIRTTVKHLSQTIGTNFDFGHYIRSLYLQANVTLNDDDIIVINDIEAVRNISTIIARQSPSTLQEYLMRRFFESLDFDMSIVIKMVNKYPNKVFAPVQDKEWQKIRCADWVNGNMGLAVSKLYIDKYYDKIAHTEIMTMIKYIQETFINMINQSNWMDSVSKKIFIEKTQTIFGQVGHPDYLLDNNWTKLNEIYAEYNFDSMNVKNCLLIRQLSAKENLIKLREPLGHDEWYDKLPTSINAHYMRVYNKIILPAAYLQPPHFHKDAPKYLNYGAVGHTIGHEIGHAFDELNRYVDKDGKRYLKWWSKINEKFMQRSKCLIKQYNNYKISSTNFSVNGYQTINDNIADNDGLKMAFYAYRKFIETHKIVEKRLPGLTKYTPEQMFFINYSQMECSIMGDQFSREPLDTGSHAPSEFRINGPISNFVEFDQVFQCKPGQGNSRINKCNVW